MEPLLFVAPPFCLSWPLASLAVLVDMSWPLASTVLGAFWVQEQWVPEVAWWS
jgi:hypothetical protein